MTLMNDSLYDALQCFEMKLSMQRNRCVQMPCRQIVQTSMQVASLMLRDEDVERNKAAYLCLINRQMNGSVQEQMMVLIVTVALLGLLDSPHARRCRNTLRDDVCEEFDEYLSLYEHFLASGDTRFAEEDFLIDTHTQIQQLTAQNEQLTYENQQLKNNLRKMKKEKPQTIIHVAGNYIAEQNIDIHDNTNCNIYATSPHPEPQAEDVTPVEKAEELFCRITREAYEKGKAQAVEAELRSAASGSAAKLVAAIRTNEALGYLDTKNMSSQALYDALNDYFGLEYKYQNFAKYRRD